MIVTTGNIKPLTLLWVSLCALLASADDFPTGSTVCVHPNGAKYTNLTECSEGEVYLIGRYVNIGVHHVASFGTSSSLNSTYYSGQLGFIADFDRNGFASSSPAYAGDYFVPGAPVEGTFVRAVLSVSSSLDFSPLPFRLDDTVHEQ